MEEKTKAPSQATPPSRQDNNSSLPTAAARPGRTIATSPNAQRPLAPARTATTPAVGLDARLEAKKLRELYQGSDHQNSFRVLLLGETGTGKTRLLQTARLPVHVDSFDPGGTLTIRDMIAKGDCVADTRYEQEDREHPTMFNTWCTEFAKRVRGRYFESFGTYCLDSSTMWAEAIMNYVLDQAKIAGQPPRFTKDYTPQKNLIQNWMKRILNLPCDVIVTGHLEGEYVTRVDSHGEEYRELVNMKYMTTGKGAITIPLLFDEIWVTTVTTQGANNLYNILTARYGRYQAKTRIGAGVFAIRETPDIKQLLQKAGWNVRDKERLL